MPPLASVTSKMITNDDESCSKMTDSMETVYFAATPYTLGGKVLHIHLEERYYMCWIGVIWLSDIIAGHFMGIMFPINLFLFKT